MLRRPATTLSITAEDIAAYEDRRAREAMLRERQALIQAQQQQQQQRILQQQQQKLPSSSPQRQQPYDPDISAEEYAEYEAHQAELLRRQGEMMRTQQQQQQQPVQRLGQPGRGASVMQTTPTPGDGGRGGRTREDRIGVGRRGR